MKTKEQLQHDVQDELKWTPSLDEAGIGVGVEDSVVTLSGHVASYSQRTAAERATKRVAGVHGVANELIVKLPSSMERDDTDIAKAAVRALEWRSDVPRDKVTAAVSKGWINLEGELEWQYQKDAAYKAVRHLPGVKGVSNLIRIKPKASAFEVKQKIQQAYKRSADIDAQHVQVEVEGSHVTLRGTVSSWAEYEDAEWAAWSAPGVAEVTNRLKVEEPALAY
jgi:osmotically-inducible protein OsmY